MDKHPQDYLCQRSPAFGVRRGPSLGKSSDVEKGGRVISESMQQWRVGEKRVAGLPQVGAATQILEPIILQPFGSPPAWSSRYDQISSPLSMIMAQLASAALHRIFETGPWLLASSSFSFCDPRLSASYSYHINRFSQWMGEWWKRRTWTYKAILGERRSRSPPS